MVADTVNHRVLDGSLVTIASEASLNEPASSFVGAVGHEFGSGPAGWGVDIAHQLGVEEFAESYNLMDGTLYIGDALHIDPQEDEQFLFRFATWEGSQWSVKTPCYGGETTADILDAFEQFEILESDEGVELRPLNPEAAILQDGTEAPSLAKRVPGIGLLHVKPLTAGLPPATGEGLAVAGGELFQDSQGEDRPCFILVGDSAQTWIMADLEVALQDVVDSVASLLISWS